MNALKRRLRTDRDFHPGEELLLAVSITAGELGSRVERVLERHGLNHARYNVLRILRGAGEEGASCGEIGERMLIRPSDVTRLVDALVERGWVERTRHPDDRRVVVQRLTGAGRATLERIQAPLEALHESIVEALGPELTRELVDRCQVVLQRVEEGALDPEPPTSRSERAAPGAER